jgi:hypothetical protein
MYSYSLLDIQPWWIVRKHRANNETILSPRQAIQRQATCKSTKPFCSTIRIGIKVSTLKDSSQRKKSEHLYQSQTIDDYDFRMDCILINNIRVAFREFLAFFYRHRIQICFAGSIMDVSFQLSTVRFKQPIFNTFIKNYSWQMLLSIGYRFQHSIKQEFVDYLQSIESDHQFYQVRLLIEFVDESIRIV